MKAAKITGAAGQARENLPNRRKAAPSRRNPLPNPPGAPAGRFEWRYGDFATVGGRPFPATMSASLTGVGHDVALSLSLSRIGNDADWETRTQVSPRYKQRSAEDIFRELMKL